MIVIVIIGSDLIEHILKYIYTKHAMPCKSKVAALSSERKKICLTYQGIDLQVPKAK